MVGWLPGASTGRVRDKDGAANSSSVAAALKTAIRHRRNIYVLPALWPPAVLCSLSGFEYPSISLLLRLLYSSLHHLSTLNILLRSQMSSYMWGKRGVAVVLSLCMIAAVVVVLLPGVITSFPSTFFFITVRTTP